MQDCFITESLEEEVSRNELIDECLISCTGFHFPVLRISGSLFSNRRPDAFKNSFEDCSFGVITSLLCDERGFGKTMGGPSSSVDCGDLTFSEIKN